MDVHCAKGTSTSRLRALAQPQIKRPLVFVHHWRDGSPINAAHLPVTTPSSLFPCIHNLIDTYAYGTLAHYRLESQQSLSCLELIILGFVSMSESEDLRGWAPLAQKESICRSLPGICLAKAIIVFPNAAQASTRLWKSCTCCPCCYSAI